ncbi:J domain-containing protein [Natrialba taiwanensis]|nr:DnaJ domain-containing protein [Natrialba taiwanensis]
MTEDFYDLLELSADASQDELKEAYREQVRVYHPDLNDDDRAQAQFVAVKKAYEILSDPVERQAYDRLGHKDYVAKRTSGIPSPDIWADTDTDADDTSSATASSENSSRETRSGSSRTNTGSKQKRTQRTKTKTGTSSSDGNRRSNRTTSNRSSGTSSRSDATSSSSTRSSSTGSSSTTGRSTGHSSNSSKSTSRSQTSSSNAASSARSSGSSTGSSSGSSRSNTTQNAGASASRTGGSTGSKTGGSSTGTRQSSGGTTSSASTGTGTGTGANQRRKRRRSSSSGTGTETRSETARADARTEMDAGTDSNADEQATRFRRLRNNAVARWWRRQRFGLTLLWLSVLIYALGLGDFALGNRTALETLRTDLLAIGPDPNGLWTAITSGRYGIDTGTEFIVRSELVAPPVEPVQWYAALTGLVGVVLLALLAVRLGWREESWDPVSIDETILLSIALAISTTLVGGPLLAGAVLMPFLFTVIVGHTRRGPGWTPSYLYVLPVLAPLCGFALGATGSATLPVELVTFVVLPVVGGLGLPLRATIRKHFGR